MNNREICEFLQANYPNDSELWKIIPKLKQFDQNLLTHPEQLSTFLNPDYVDALKSHYDQLVFKSKLRKVHAELPKPTQPIKYLTPFQQHVHRLPLDLRAEICGSLIKCCRCGNNMTDRSAKWLKLKSGLIVCSRTCLSEIAQVFSMTDDNYTIYPRTKLYHYDEQVGFERSTHCITDIITEDEYYSYPEYRTRDGKYHIDFDGTHGGLSWSDIPWYDHKDGGVPSGYGVRSCRLI